MVGTKKFNDYSLLTAIDNADKILFRDDTDGLGKTITKQNFDSALQTQITSNDSDITALQATAIFANIIGLGTQTQALNMGTNLINAVVDPVSAQDAATKNYVDTQLATQNQIGELSDVTNSTPADGHFFIYDSITSNYENQIISGDITISKDGVAAINTGVIVDADLASGVFASITGLGVQTQTQDHGQNDLHRVSNLGIRTANATTGMIGGILLSTNTAPTSDAADIAQIYAGDIAGAGTTGIIIRSEDGVKNSFSSAFDLEGYGAIGNGAAPDSDITLIIDRDFNTTTVGKALLVQGIISVTGGTADIFHTQLDPGKIDLQSGLHDLVSSVKIAEPNITETGGTVTTAISLYIEGAPTEGTNNYALFVDSGDSRFDGSIFGSNADSYQLVDEAASGTNPTVIPNRSNLATGWGDTSGSGGNITGIISGNPIIKITSVGFEVTQNDQSVQGSRIDSFACVNEVSSATNPTLIPDRSELTSGIGGTGNEVSIIGSGSEVITVGNNTLGFYAATPVARPTGVAVTASGIHAALVSLGMITA